LLETVLVDECTISADNGWNVSNRGSRIIRAESFAVLGQTYVRPRYTVNWQIKLADDD
jgi:hypothetical protein